MMNTGMQLKLSSPSQVRRNLFGLMDTKSNNEFMVQQLEALAEHSCSVWNFDFFRGIPLKGRYLWESVNPMEMPMACNQEVLHNRIEHHSTSHKDECSVTEKDNVKKLPISTLKDQRSAKKNSLRRLLSKNLKKEKFEKEIAIRSSLSRRTLTRKVKEPQSRVLVQTSIKGFLKVCKPRSSTRLRSSYQKSLAVKRATAKKSAQEAGRRSGNSKKSPRLTSRKSIQATARVSNLKGTTTRKSRNITSRMSTRCCSISYGSNRTRGR